MERLPKAAAAGPLADYAIGARVMTREGYPGTIDDILEGPADLTTYFVTLDNGQGGGEYAEGEITPLNEPATASRIDASVERTAADDYPELGTILTDRLPPALHTTAAGRGECPYGGDHTIVDQNGYSFCTRCGWEPESGTIPANPETPYTAAKEPAVTCWGSQQEVQVPDSAIAGSGYYAEVTCPSCPRRFEVRLKYRDEWAYAKIPKHNTPPQKQATNDEARDWGLSEGREDMEGEGFIEPPYPEDEAQAIAARLAKTADIDDWGNESYKTWRCDRCDSRNAEWMSECGGCGTCSMCGEVLPTGSTPQETYKLRQPHRKIHETEEWDPNPRQALYLPPVPPGEQRSSTSDLTPKQKPGYDEGFRQGQEGITREPSDPLDEDFMIGFEIGWAEGVTVLREPAFSWDIEDLGKDQTADLPSSIAPTYAPHMLGSISTEADWSYDWCRFRKNSECWLPRELNEEASKQAGYAVWVPFLRGTCYRSRWVDQQKCPTGEPGPHVPGGFTDATKPWEEGGQRGGTPSGVQAAKTSYNVIDDLGMPYVLDLEKTAAFEVTARWSDIREKAKRIRSEGGVRLVAVQDNVMVAHVKGDSGVYETEIVSYPGKRNAASWACGCKWGSYSWGRSGPWKKFEGRMCSHALALQYEAQSRGAHGREMTLDEKQPAWMDQKHVHRPGDYSKDKQRYSQLQANSNLHPTLEQVDDEAPPLEMLASVLMSEGAKYQTVRQALLAQGAERPVDIIKAARRTTTFWGRVRNRLEKLILDEDDGVVDPKGGKVPAREVLYPKWHPTKGLNPTDNTPLRVGSRAPFDREAATSKWPTNEPASTYGMTYDPAAAADPRLAEARSSVDWDSLPLEQIPIDAIVATEEKVSAEAIEHYRDIPVPPNYFVEVVELSPGRYALSDGHHRLAKFHIMNLRMVDAKVYRPAAQQRAAAVVDDAVALLEEGWANGEVEESSVSWFAPTPAGQQIAHDGLPPLEAAWTITARENLAAAARALLTMARRNEPDTTLMLSMLALEYGGDMVGLDNRLKTEESLLRKMHERAHEHGGDAGLTAINISDSLRYTMMFSTSRYTQGVKGVMADLASGGYRERVKNYWEKGDPYDGINVAMLTPKGHPFELQFHTPESLKAKDLTHRLYEQWRTNPDPEVREELAKEMIDITDATPVPAGILSVPTLKRQPLSHLGAKQPPAVLYHYTSEIHLPSILRSGHLRLTDSNIEISGAGPKVVWLTTSVDPAGNGLDGGFGKGAVRFTVMPNARTTHHWPTWAFEQGIEGYWYDALDSAGGGGSENWWVCTEPISLADVLTVEVNGVPYRDFGRRGAKQADLDRSPGDLLSDTSLAEELDYVWDQLADNGHALGPEIELDPERFKQQRRQRLIDQLTGARGEGWLINGKPYSDGVWIEVEPDIWYRGAARGEIPSRAVVKREGEKWLWETQVLTFIGAPHEYTGWQSGGKTPSGSAKTLEQAQAKALAAIAKDQEFFQRYDERQRANLGKTFDRAAAAKDQPVWVMHQFKGTGSTHLMRTDGVPVEAMPDLTWCGVKSQFKHVVRHGARDEVTCPKCLRQIAKGQPLSWGSRGSSLAKKDDGPSVSGVALKAADTGRILMLQRGLEDDSDPAAGTWEFPGGHHEDGDLTSLHAGIREWEEEVGVSFPAGAVVQGTWTSPDGVYQGHVVVIPKERDLILTEGRDVDNPDDPDGDASEQVAWWDPDHACKNPALREECKKTPWKILKSAHKEGTKMDISDEFGSLFEGAMAAAPDPGLLPVTAERGDEWGLDLSYEYNTPVWAGPNGPNVSITADEGTADVIDGGHEESALPVTYGDEEEPNKVAAQLQAALGSSTPTSNQVPGLVGSSHEAGLPLCPKCNHTVGPGDVLEVVPGVGLQHKGPCPSTKSSSMAPPESDAERAQRLLAYADARARGETPPGPDPFAHITSSAQDNELAAAASNYLATKGGGLQSEALKSYSAPERQAIIDEGEGEEGASNLDRLDIKGTHYEAMGQMASTASSAVLAQTLNGGVDVPEDEDMTFLAGDPNLGD